MYKSFLLLILLSINAYADTDHCLTNHKTEWVVMLPYSMVQYCSSPSDTCDDILTKLIVQQKQMPVPDAYHVGATMTWSDCIDDVGM